MLIVLCQTLFTLETFILDFSTRYGRRSAPYCSETLAFQNPGFSGTWLYYLVNEDVSLGPNHLSNSRPMVQIRMEKYTLYIPQYDKAYSTFPVNNFVHCFKPDTALYLFEPSASLIEPYITEVQTTLTCSPDRRRYHEFAKCGAVKYYMPCWNLAELQVIGAHAAAHCDPELKDNFTPETNENRFDRFGGIFRYVIPLSKDAVFSAQRSQDSVLERAKPVHLFLLGNDYEKTDEMMKEDVILQYRVHYGGEHKGKEDEFQHFSMKTISDLVKRKIMTLSDSELYEVTSMLQCSSS